MQRFIFLVICCMVYVRTGIIEIPSGCTHDTFKIPGKLHFKKQFPLQFTVDNSEKVAADALKGSRKVYKTKTSDIFSILVVQQLPFKPALLTNELCFSVKGIPKLGIGFAPVSFGPLVDYLKVTDPTMWTMVCWSRATEANFGVAIIMKNVTKRGAQIKNISMKYCLSPK